jgi:hypothetical protein
LYLWLNPKSINYVIFKECSVYKPFQKEKGVFPAIKYPSFIQGLTLQPNGTVERMTQGES